MAIKRKTTSRAGTKKDTVGKGLGSASTITVKHKRATAKQRRVIDQSLAEAHDLGAARRVMVAVVMALTQESVAGANIKTTGNDDTGLYQQGRNWISVIGARQPGPATKAFLVTGPTSWKKVHGSLKHAPADLESAIKRVQGSVGGYAQWQSEAEQTVAIWLGNDGFGTSGGTTYAKRYEFTRGERHGNRETSWDAMARLADEVNDRRWAAGNVLYYVSDDELRAGEPALSIHGDEGWLLTDPLWDWGAGRAITEITLRVLAERWHIMPGAVVVLETGGPTAGRWLVWSVEGESLDNPEAHITLRRPTRKKPEPATETGTTSTTSGGSGSGLLAECQRISSQNRAYVYGGGHGVPLSRINPHQALDCSSSVSLALKRAGMFDGSQAITSGAFASSWGKAGKGKDFTVWANKEHVWIEFHTAGRVKRFDTSPHGNGKSGPHTRTTARNDQGRFSARHWR